MKRIAFFLPTLTDGGAERVVINLLHGMARRGVPLDLVLAYADGPYLSQVPKEVRLINLAAPRTLMSIVPLARYLRQVQPHGLVAHLNFANVVAIVARHLSRVPTRLVLVEHSTVIARTYKSGYMRLAMPRLMQLLYHQADTLVGVSQGVAHSLEQHLHMQPGEVTVIYNPVVDDSLLLRSYEPPSAPQWFRPDAPPVIVSAGRLQPPKDFATLIRAFAILRRQRPARLLILGEGAARPELEQLIGELGLSSDIALLGFVTNPYAYMRRASLFVLSSHWEGLPTVLIEALACGAPVVATDCPDGPAEILAHGRYGRLVPVGDAAALAQAMHETLDTPTDRTLLAEHAMHFSVDQAITHYLDVLNYQDELYLSDLLHYEQDEPVYF